MLTKEKIQLLQEENRGHLNHWITGPELGLSFPFCCTLLISYRENFLKMLQVSVCMIEKKAVLIKSVIFTYCLNHRWPHGLGIQALILFLMVGNSELYSVCTVSESKSECISGIILSLSIPSGTADTVCLLGCLSYYQKNQARMGMESMYEMA